MSYFWKITNFHVTFQKHHHLHNQLIVYRVLLPNKRLNTGFMVQFKQPYCKRMNQILLFRKVLCVGGHFVLCWVSSDPPPPPHTPVSTLNLIFADGSECSFVACQIENII